MVTVRCTICGSPWPGRRYEAHGWASTMPASARGKVIRSCERPECIAECERRKAALDAVTPVIWPKVEGVSLAQMDLFAARG